MNTVDKGRVSFLLALIRHIVLIIPLSLLMNTLWGLPGLIWSQLIADFLNAIIATVILLRKDDSGAVGGQSNDLLEVRYRYSKKEHHSRMANTPHQTH